MEYFEKKITYLSGLCDGSDFPAESKEGKIFHGILDVLDDMAFNSSRLQRALCCVACEAGLCICDNQIYELRCFYQEGSAFVELNGCFIIFSQIQSPASQATQHRAR